MLDSNKFFDNRAMYLGMLKILKKELPRECTFLSSFTNRNGVHMVKYVVNKKEYYSSIPPDFTFSAADVNQLRDNILSKIK